MSEAAPPDMKKQAFFVLAVLAILEAGFWSYTYLQKHNSSNDETRGQRATVASPDAH